MIPKIKKAVIYFDDGTTTGSGYGSGYGSGASGNIKRKIAKNPIFENNFIFFHEEKGDFQAIPIFRVIRIVILEGGDDFGN